MTDEHRKELRLYLCDVYHQKFKEEFDFDVRKGWPAFKGVNNMTDEELLREAVSFSSEEEVNDLLGLRDE